MELKSSRAQKQPSKDMRIRIPNFFSVLKNWRSNFFIFTPKRFYKVEILNMAEKVLKSGMVLYLITKNTIISREPLAIYFLFTKGERLQMNIYHYEI